MHEGDYSGAVRQFQTAVEALGGYDASSMGQVVAEIAGTGASAR